MARRRAQKKHETPSGQRAAQAPIAKADDGAVVEPEALVVTHLFDPGEDGEPYPATIRLTGRRAGVGGRPKPGDSFVREEKVDRVVPGSGPVSISTWVYGLSPGEWSVTADLVLPRADARGRRMTGSARPEVQPLRSAMWSWRRWRAVPGPVTALVKTRWALIARLARIPAVMPGTIPVLVAIGAVIALTVLAAHVGDHALPVGSALLVTAIASVAGLAGAKLWYARLHPEEPIFKPGWAVDGFVVVAPLTAIAALVALGLPVATYLDEVTPSLFLTVALGRVGCFFTGCCAGRVTSARWGMWSSDQRLGARRIPTQLLESAIGLALGIGTLVLVVGTDTVGSGLIFVAAFATYLVVRQLLLRLRAEPRRFIWQRRRLVEQSP